ncbi:LysR substrate-binding domain-containing protein [Sphingomonas crocodyli]|uniref:LysR family transcriptional regulator n=1 Tax=Sphingomonas crocodyli TaxID=1979270 RepID=A0A437LZS3_9SPHN|nr:LysR substrate-binding domain-containing protein [Sphingomonas crocodyli]RVT90907.1 LysR family transcriptional regulator [Sphingomonas crocodyli]
MAPALSSISEALEIVEGLRATPSGRIRLNSSEVAAARLLPALADFMARYPQIDVELRSDGLLSDVVADGFDAGIRLAEAVPQDMVAVSLSDEEQLIVVASPVYLAARKAPQRPEDLADHDCIPARLPSGRVMAWEFERDGATFAVPVRGRAQMGSVALAYQAAVLGLGIAYVSRCEADQALAQGRLVQLLGDWTPPFPGLRLYYPRQRHHSAAFRLFLDFVRGGRIRI